MRPLGDRRNGATRSDTIPRKTRIRGKRSDPATSAGDPACFHSFNPETKFLRKPLSGANKKSIPQGPFFTNNKVYFSFINVGQNMDNSGLQKNGQDWRLLSIALSEQCGAWRSYTTK